LERGGLGVVKEEREERTGKKSKICRGSYSDGLPIGLESVL
jgi:hypothetical protein